MQSDNDKQILININWKEGNVKSTTPMLLLHLWSLFSSFYFWLFTTERKYSIRVLNINRWELEKLPIL